MHPGWDGPADASVRDHQQQMCVYVCVFFCFVWGLWVVAAARLGSVGCSDVVGVQIVACGDGSVCYY